MGRFISPEFCGFSFRPQSFGDVESTIVLLRPTRV